MPDQYLIDYLPREDIADAMRHAFDELAEMAIENWAEGYWQDVPLDLTVGGAFDMLAGYVQSLAEVEWDPGDDPLKERVFVVEVEEDA